MRSLGLAVGFLVAALSACAGRAGAPATKAGSAAGSTEAAPAASVEGEAAPRAERGADGDPRGRPAGIRTLDINGQRTYWVEHCPTDSSSPLREPCSMTRVDLGAE